ncbi:anti-sigma factor family protein [Streptomyces pathocidini]|uniref:Anti-sigma factor family protein n=2 Tax=Streptomyces pathocidini TaxID=1650571 RepID=A0ABW7UR59_9ACTN
MSGSGGLSPVEQHLGDRLAALVDGELAHDARERVLAHLATCWKCKAEADAQRRLKSVFAEAAPPPPTEGFLARLQGLPGGGGEGGSGDGEGGPPFGSGPVLDVRHGGGGFAYAPVDGYGPSKQGGFRIHDVERSSSRGRRFAFAAAGAVSMAALALGGALPLEAAVDGTLARGEDTGAASRPESTGRATGAPSASAAASLTGSENALLAATGSGHRTNLLGVPAPPAPVLQPPHAMHRYSALTLPASSAAPATPSTPPAQLALPSRLPED